jgi:iron complex outermembrane receptor protein
VSNWDKERLLRSSVLAGFAAALFAAAPAVAQEPEQTDAEEEEEEASSGGDRIVVTGSRLRRDEFTSVSPLQVVDGDVARDLGLVDASQILTNTSVATGQQNTVTTTTGLALQQAFTTIGSQTPSLRGLGSSVTGRARSLVLVNGRRLGPIGVGGAPANPDTSMIPGSLIERTEILLDGASSIYGSDAVAGVINYILRQDFDGVEASAYSAITEDGLGQNNVLSIATGISNDRGWMNFAIEYQDHEEVEKFDVYDSILNGRLIDGGFACNLDVGVFDDGREVTFCSDTPAGFIISGAGNLIFDSGNRTPGVTYDDIGGALAGTGLLRRSGSFFLPVTDPDINGYPQNHADTFIPDTRRITFFTQGEYDVDFGSNTSFFFEAMYSERELKSQFTTQEIMPYSGTNPFNPLPGVGGVFVHSTLVEIDQQIDVGRFVGGLRGDLPFINFGPLANWSYELSGSFHRSNGVQSQFGFLHEDRAVQGIANAYTDPVTGAPACDTDVGDNFFGFDTVRAPITCVPLNPFVESFMLTGRFATDAENNFALSRTYLGTQVEQVIGSGFVTGDIFEFPAGGTSQLLLGFEYRSDKVETTPSDTTRMGLAQGVDADVGSTGGRDVRELFAEISLPILEGQPFAESLSIEGAARWTEEEFSGAAWTYQIKGEYSPVDYLSFRAGFGTSFRAPDTGEQFGTGTLFVSPSRIDPCIVSSLQIDPITNTYDPALETRDPVLLQNCIDLGLDPTTLGTVGQGTPTLAFVSLPVAFGNFGNLATNPETSEALFAGASIDQPWFDRFDLRLGVTYFEYEIEGSIAQLGRSQIVNQCMTSVGLTDPLCAFMERDPATGLLLSINEASINTGPTTSRGYDVNMRFNMDLDFLPLEDVINFDWNVVATRQLENTEDITTTGSPTDLLGDLTTGGGFPEHQVVSTATFSWRDLSVLWRTRFIDDLMGTPDRGNSFSACFDPALPGQTGGLQDDCTEKEYADEQFQHDLTAVYSTDTWVFRAGVTNLFDDVQLVDSDRGALYNVCITCGHDIYGRRFFASVTKSF